MSLVPSFTQLKLKTSTGQVSLGLRLHAMRGRRLLDLLSPAPLL